MKKLPDRLLKDKDGSKVTLDTVTSRYTYLVVSSHSPVSNIESYGRARS